MPEGDMPSAIARLRPAETIAEVRLCLGAREGLSRGVRGDHDLNPGCAPPSSLCEAAVLVGVVDRAQGPSVIFTQRTAHLAAHAGQISFPGGHVEPDDADAEETALREAEEEIGLPRARVELLGRLDTYLTRTGFRVVPVVGVVTPPERYQPDPHEVAEVFEVPLSVLLAPELPERRPWQTPAGERWFYAFPWQERVIWGATAGMLVNLRQVLRAS